MAIGDESFSNGDCGSTIGAHDVHRRFGQMTCLKLLVRGGSSPLPTEPAGGSIGPYVRPICNSGCPISFKRILFQPALNSRVPRFFRKHDRQR